MNIKTYFAFLPSKNWKKALADQNAELCCILFLSTGGRSGTGKLGGTGHILHLFSFLLL